MRRTGQGLEEERCEQARASGIEWAPESSLTVGQRSIHDPTSLEYSDRSLQHLKILKRITVEYDEVSEFSGAYRADPAVCRA